VRNTIHVNRLATDGGGSREKAIKDLLHRSADKLDEWMCSGILGSLKIPVAWVNEARVSIFHCLLFPSLTFREGYARYLRGQGFRCLPAILECRVISTSPRPCRRGACT
jgi:hypothetical protein